MKIKVQKNHLDSNGHVNYAVYLNWIKDCHSNLWRGLGYSFTKLRKELKLMTFVRQVKIDYLRELLLKDEVTISTKIEKIGNSSLILKHTFYKEKTKIAKARIVLVFIGENRKPIKIPHKIRRLLVELTKNFKNLSNSSSIV